MKTENENARTVSTMLNSFSFSYKGFCNSMEREHKTLQQNFTRLCVEWLLHCASDNYNYDGRNEASHLLGKKIENVLNETAIPFI